MTATEACLRTLPSADGGYGISYTVTEYLLMGRAPPHRPVLPLAPGPRQGTGKMEELGLIDWRTPAGSALRRAASAGGYCPNPGSRMPSSCWTNRTSALDVANQARFFAQGSPAPRCRVRVLFTTHNPDHALMLDATIACSVRMTNLDAQASKDSSVSGIHRSPVDWSGFEVLTSEVLSRTFNTDLTVTSHPRELDRSSVRSTSLDT